jgi:tRNA pseudouridine38-40 synthase
MSAPLPEPTLPAPAGERLKLAIAYDGRAFQGWQSQATGEGVQDYLERAFAKLTAGASRVQGAGRTDAGVHALAQIAHVDVPCGAVPWRKWPLALNAHLPDAVRVLRVERAAPGFHAQFQARGKVYAYRLWNSHCLHPLEAGRVWHVPGALDLALLREGARLLEGTHDFAAFAAHRSEPPKKTVRTIWSIRISRRADLVTLRFRGNGFLYHMVRLLTGSLVRCAQRRQPISWLQDLLEQPAGRKSHHTAPAEGLFLARVLY